MDYQRKYMKYKTKYLMLKSGLDPQTGGTKKCSIENTDKILFGDTGSTALIVITKDKKAYKIFTTYIYMNDEKKVINKRIKNSNRRVNNEISIYKALTENIIDKNISDHYVKYISKNSCNNASKLFYDCPKSYNAFLKMSAEKKTRMCSMKFKGFPTRELQEEYDVVELEYCDYSCANFISDISKMPIADMERYLDIFFFQIIYTIVATQKIYPYFSHNDLFMRNILGLREKNNGNYYTYTINSKNYYVPQIMFFPKINDFGMTNLDNNFHDVKLFKSSFKDIFNILYDVYNGGNLGSINLSELCKDDPDKIKFLKLYFGNYFDISVVDEYVMNSKQNIDWDWNNILDNEFLKSIDMKNPSDLLDDYFYDIFGKHNENIFQWKI